MDFETVDSARTFWRRALEGLGLDVETGTAVDTGMRERNPAQLALEQAEGKCAGIDMLLTHTAPESLSIPRRESIRLDSGASP